MPWKELSLVSQRLEFVKLAEGEATNVAALCRRFQISRKTGYKWLARHRDGGAEALDDRSRRPRRSPTRCEPPMERQVLAVRRLHPAWGGRKIRSVLKNQGVADPPAASTITEILRRHGVLNAEEAWAPSPAAWQRFEHPRPNDLWQMDFKGHFGLANGSRCHPLTVLDDHSRYNLVLQACGDQTTATVKRQLTTAFERYGLPRRMLMDNGSPWGDCAQTRYTPLTVWLLRLDVGVSHGRPYHPQTQGKEERFHRTLSVELLREQAFDDHAHAQRGFDAWRPTYNFQRPHEALGMLTPAQRYQPSRRSMPATLPSIEYPRGDTVRKVQEGGRISYRGRTWRLPKAFRGEPVALRPTDRDAVLAVYYVGHQIAELDLHQNRVSSAGAASARSAHSSHPGR
jgi:transposase InsO family protein